LNYNTVKKAREFMIAYQDICDETQFAELKKIFATENELEVLRMAVKTVLKKNTHENLLKLCGEVIWEGDLEEMRGLRA